MADLIIGCRLPHGIILENPDPEAPKVEIEVKGLNSSNIIGAEYMTTPVDADFWALWSKFHKDSPLLKSGSLFAVKDESSAKSKAKELKDEKTGFEPMPQNGPGIKKAD